jgi:hypothetical protein
MFGGFLSHFRQHIFIQQPHTVVNIRNRAYSQRVRLHSIIDPTERLIEGRALVQIRLRCLSGICTQTFCNSIIYITRRSLFIREKCRRFVRSAEVLKRMR